MEQKEKLNVNVNMNGKDYLEYVKYKDSQKWKPSENDKKAFMIIGGALGLAIIIAVIIDIVTPNPQPIPISISWEGVGMVMCLLAGLGWAFHGTGFLLVRR